MRSPDSSRRPSRPPSRWSRRNLFALSVLVVVLLTLASAGAAKLQVIHSTETLAGLQAPTDFLTHWQQVGSLSSTTPAGFLRLWSAAVATPTRLPGVSSNSRLDLSAAGDQAAAWVFNETVGLPVSTEIEIAFTVQYHYGATTTTTTITAYIETQRRAPAGTLTFTVYWDSGYATGVTWVNQLEVAQVCSAVGTCP